MTRRLAAVAGLAVAALITAPMAGATPRVSIDVQPAAPHLSGPVTVTVTAPRLKPGKSYRVFIERLRLSPRVCMSTTDAVTMRRLADGRFTATLRPGPQFGVDSPPAKVWCPGAATVRVERQGPGKISTTGFARRAIRFVRASDEAVPPPIPAHEVTFTLLAGSTLTAWAPGRPERSTPVTGTLSGAYRQTVTLQPDLTYTDIAGTLALPSLAADPLCPGSAPPTSVDVDKSSSMVFGLTGSHLTLVLRGQPTQLFGCGPPGGLTGTTPLTVSSTPLGAPNYRMPMLGVIGDLALPGGTQGGITADFTVKQEISKRWLP